MTADLLSVGALLERAVALDGDGEAARDSGEAYSWAEIGARVAARMSTLASFGVGRGARVAVLSDNGLPFLELYFAAAGLGAVLVPLNTRLSPAEVAGVLDQAGPLVLVARPGLATVAREALDRAAAAPTLLWLEGPPEGGPRSGEEVDRLEARDRPDGAFAATPVDPTALAHLYFTSGTTGRPKGVMLTHRNVVTHALHAAVELELSTRDVWAHVAPMFHLADAWATFALTLVRGVHVFLPRFQAVPALDLLEGEGVTLTNLVPTMLADMVADESAAGRDWSSLRLMLSGGAPIAPEVVARIRSTFKTEYVQTYGMTETSPYLTLSRLSRAQQSLDEEERLRLSARTGRPFLGVDLEVVDADGHRVPRDDATVGEIRVRGATVTPGYWNDEDATDAAIREGWLYTGDLATIDAHGFVEIRDRAKDMIVTGGENVYSIEVENALYAHPAVLEAAAFGRADERYGERVCAAVALKDGARTSEEELLAHCRERLAGYKLPRQLEFHDRLPRTGSGKLAKRLLRDGPDEKRPSE